MDRTKIFIISLVAFFTLQPVSVALSLTLPTVVHAADSSASAPVGNEEWTTGEDDVANFVSAEDQVNQPASNPIDTFDELLWMDSEKGALQMSPQDTNAIENGSVDVRVTDYLATLVTPVEYGGYGFDHVKVQQVVKGYPTTGVGKFDREGSTAISEADSTVSAHARGQAADISEAGSITCKLVEKHHIGGDTTHWQPPKPVKVAWQSTGGIARNPTPKGNSLVGTAGGMTADSILSYLNQSGQLDYYIDYAKGLDLKTILSYVGANVLQKDLGIAQVNSDPMASDIIHALGGAILTKDLPGLATDAGIGDPNDDVRVSVAKSRIEQALNMPAGSLSGYGWNQILTNAGKRQLEGSLSLPSQYFETHTLQDANNDPSVKKELSYVNRSDDSLNVFPGTVDKVLKNNTDAFKTAGINVIENAFKLSPDQRQALEDAVQNNKTPNIDFSGVSSDNQLTADDMVNLFSEDPQHQKTVQDSLKKLGINLLTSIIKNAAPVSNQGLTSVLLNQILNPNQTIKLGDLENTLGSSTIASNVGLTDSETKQLQSGGNNQIYQKIANYFNSELGLAGSSVLTPGDVSGINSSEGSSTVLAKIGGTQADKALGWNDGTGYKVMTGAEKITDALSESFSNSISSMLDLGVTGVSLTGNITQNFGNAIVEQRLGLAKDTVASTTTSLDLYNKLGQSAFYQQFGINSSKSLTDLRSDQSFWSDVNNQNDMQLTDINLGLPIGTTAKYLQGQVTTRDYTKTAATTNIGNLTADKIWSYFGLEDKFQVSGSDIVNIFNVLKGGDNVTFDQTQAALSSIYTILGRSIDSKAGFSVDTMVRYFTAPDSQAASQILLDQGLRTFTQALGINTSGYSDADLVNLANDLKLVFNTSGVPIDLSRLQPGDVRFTYPGDPATAMSNFLDKALNIPDQYKSDANFFLTGDFGTGLALASFNVFETAVNPYLPAGSQLTYADLRNTLMPDQVLIDAQSTITYSDAGISNPTPAQLSLLSDESRKIVMENAKRTAEYTISDGFLRKVDIAVPVGFSEAMFAGTSQDRAQMLEEFAFNKIDQAFAKIDPTFQQGTFEKIFKGELSSQQSDAIVLSIINRSGVSFGDFSNEFISNFYTFVKSSNKSDFYSGSSYQGMWSYFDGWLQKTLNIADLPAGLAKSLYFASQNGWSLNASQTVNGVVTVQSLSSLGKDLLTEKISQWGDQQLHVPVGTVYRTYQAVKNVIDASRALAAAHAAQNAAQVTKAQGNLANAQAALAVLIITTALDMCAACQAFFGSIDQAIAAPPGFTNAAVAGAIAFAFGLGPAGLYIAAAIYLFGAYKVEYLCPTPPQDPYAVTDLDQGPDKQNFGYTITDPNKPIIPNPAPGQDPFKWENGVQFSDGNNSALWMSWARYFTGRLLEATVGYGEDRATPWKPLQVLSYRKANIEYFKEHEVDAFGYSTDSNPDVGMGFTEDTTKVTDSVHVAFGGLF